MIKNNPDDIYAIMNSRLVPYGVSLELTALCNVDCVHCYHAVCDDNEMSTEEVTGLLDSLARLGTMELTLTGGEPLLRGDFPHILNHAVRNARFSIKIFTNLTLLTAELADLFASLPLNSIETSILGPDAETHDMITRRPGSFDALLKSIGLLTDRGVNVSAKTVLMKPNRRDLKAMYELAEELGITFRHDYSVFVESDGGRGPLSLQVSDGEIDRSMSATGDTANAPPQLCNIGKSVMSVAADGSVYPCGPYSEKAGSIREADIADIWYDSPVFKQVRSLKHEDYHVCHDCVYRKKCNGCIAMGIGLSAGRKYPCRLARKRLRHLT